MTNGEAISYSTEGYDPKRFSEDPENYRINDHPLLSEKLDILSRRIERAKAEYREIQHQQRFIRDNFLTKEQAKVLVYVYGATTRTRFPVDELMFHKICEELGVSETQTSRALVRRGLITNVGTRREPQYMPTVTGAGVASLLYSRHPELS